MSDKTQLRWESPLDIYVPHELNNRPLDAKYVESLEDSMHKQGYLPTYPIVCYRRLEMPNEVFDGKTDALYICAAGFHRTTAAKNINLDRVYVELRSGTFEDYLETLNTDNFQFDPDTDPSLGQVWTKTEKRKACKQLLLLPKYFKLANIALSELWHTSESNVRRWRDEVASSIDDGSLEAPFPISEEWQSNLKEILDSNVREMNDGSVVKIRSKSNESKYEFYWALQRKVENHKDLDWQLHINPYCKMMYEEDVDKVSMQKLAELDRLIQEHDPEFMKVCRELGEKKQKLNAAQEECHKAYRKAKDNFNAYLVSQDLVEDRYISQHSENYKNCWKAFGRALSRKFGKNLLGSLFYSNEVHKYENETYQLQELNKHFENGADYIEAFAQRQVNAQRKKRSKLGGALIKVHYKMLTAVQEKYPGIDIEKFCFAVDSDSMWLKTGDTPAKPMHAVINIPDEKKTGELPKITEHYERVLEKIAEGADWIAALVPSPVEQQLAVQREVAVKAEVEMWKTFEASEYSMCFYREDLLSAAAKVIGCPKEIPDPTEMDKPTLWTEHFQAIQTAINEKSGWVEDLLKARKAFNLALTNAEFSLSSLWDTFDGIGYLTGLPRETFAIAAAKHLNCYEKGQYGSGENYLLEKDYALLKNLTTSELKKWKKRFETIEDAIYEKSDWIEALIPAAEDEVNHENTCPESSDFNYRLESLYIGLRNGDDTEAVDPIKFQVIPSRQMDELPMTELPDPLKIELLKLVERLKEVAG